MIELVWARFPWGELMALPGFTTGQDHLEIAQALAARDWGWLKKASGMTSSA